MQPWAESNCDQTLQESHRKWWNHPSFSCLFGCHDVSPLNAAWALEQKGLENSASVLSPHWKASNLQEHHGVQLHNTQKQHKLLIYDCNWSSGLLNSSSKVIRNKLYSRGMLQPLTRAISRADHICLAAIKRSQWTLTPSATGVIVVASSTSLCVSGTWTRRSQHLMAGCSQW